MDALPLLQSSFRFHPTPEQSMFIWDSMHSRSWDKNAAAFHSIVQNLLLPQFALRQKEDKKCHTRENNATAFSHPDVVENPPHRSPRAGNLDAIDVRRAALLAENVELF